MSAQPVMWEPQQCVKHKVRLYWFQLMFKAPPPYISSSLMEEYTLFLGDYTVNLSWMSRSVLRTEVETDRTKKGPNWTYVLTRKLCNRKHYRAMPRQK